MGRVETLNKRLKRWVSHRNLDLGLAFELWINWVWSSCDFSRPILLVDETKLGDKIGILRVSLAFEQRAIPLVWRCYRTNSAAAWRIRKRCYGH